MKLAKRTSKSSTAKTVAEFIDQQIEWTEKSNLQIADECGFPKSNIVSMIRYGKTKLPMNRVGRMAKALEVDPVFFLGMVMAEYDPEGWAVIRGVIAKPVISANEQGWIEVIRKLSPEDPAVTVAAEECLKKALA
jgi:hypothetical protein